jgi:limonene-1,2-epoxide hydrolase
MGSENERLVLDFVHAAYGERMDVDTMISMVSEDFVYQLNVPRSPVVRGREAARAVFEGFTELSTGMVAGSEIRTVVSNDDTVVVERVDVNDIGGTRVTFHVAAFFDVRDGEITCWREYWDTGSSAKQMGLQVQPLPGEED